MSVVARERLVERVECYARTHPEATRAAVLGRFRLAPDEEGEERALVENVLAAVEATDAPRETADETGGASA